MWTFFAHVWKGEHQHTRLTHQNKETSTQKFLILSLKNKFSKENSFEEKNFYNYLKKLPILIWEKQILETKIVFYDSKNKKNILGVF